MPVLLWGPLFVGPLFGRTCWTCLNSKHVCLGLLVERWSRVSEMIRQTVPNGWVGYTKTSSAVCRQFDWWDSKLVFVDESETVSRWWAVCHWMRTQFRQVVWSHQTLIGASPRNKSPTATLVCNLSSYFVTCDLLVLTWDLTLKRLSVAVWWQVKYDYWEF